MASKTAAAPAESEETREETPDSPLIDASVQAIKKMLAKAKERGYVTYDELNAALPQEQVSSEQIEDIMAILSEMGVNVVDNEESEEAGEDKPAEAPQGETQVVVPTGNTDDELERTDAGSYSGSDTERTLIFFSRRSGMSMRPRRLSLENREKSWTRIWVTSGSSLALWSIRSNSGLRLWV